MKYNFLKITFFCIIVLFFIPSFTALAMFLFQSFSGIECSKFWNIVSVSSIIFAITSPVLFYKYIKFLSATKFKTLDLKLIAFNFFEYIFIQFGLLPWFVHARTFCNSHDPQMGAVLIITAWIALPILIVISYLFGYFYHKNKSV